MFKIDAAKYATAVALSVKFWPTGSSATC